MTIDFNAAFPTFRREVRRLQQLRPSKQRRIMKSAFNSSIGPVKTALRRTIRREANYTGTLAKSITSKAGAFGSGNEISAYVLAGARSRTQVLIDPETGTQRRVNPANYFHLVDQGTRPHRQPNGYRFTTVSGRRVLYQPPGGTQHPGTRRLNMRERATQVIGPKTQARFLKQFEKRLDKCLN